MAKRKSIGPRLVLALALGVGIGVAVWFLTRGLPGFLSLVLTIFAGAGGFLAGANIGSTRGISRDRKVDRLVGLSKEATHTQEVNLRQTLLLIQTQRTKLESIVFKITDDQLRSLGDKLLKRYGDFADAVKQDPKDIRPVRRFLNYYGEAAASILEKYLHLRNLPAEQQNEESRAALARVGTSLAELERGFATQYARLLDNDLMEMDTELTVLEKTLRLEGLSPGNDPED